MTLVNSTPDYVELYLATAYSDGDTTLDCYAKNSTYKLTDQKTSSLITSFRCVGISRTDSNSWMGMAVSNVVTNGTFAGATRYTLTLRTSDGANPMVGLANTDDGTSADDNIITANKLTTLLPDSLIMIPVGSATFTELFDSLSSISATASAEAGEAISARESLSLHTDGKLYLYHATNYPNLVGIANDDYASGATATYWRNGGTSTGHSSLTVGAIYYGENTGTVTSTSSGTTRPLGQATTATTIFINPQIPSVSEASQVQAEAGTAQGVYNSPLRSEQHRLANLDTAETLTSKKLKTATIADTTDDTKEISFDVSGITTGTERTITVPDRNVSLGYSLAKYSTMFETAGRFTSTSSSGTATFGTSGLVLDTTATASRYITIKYLCGDNSIMKMFTGDVNMNFVVSPSNFSVNTETGYVGLWDGTTMDDVNADAFVTAGGSYDDGIGFFFDQVGGALNLYGYNSDATEKALTLLQTFTNGSVYSLNAVLSTGKIQFYVNGVLRATHTTYLPTSIAAPNLTMHLDNNGGGNQTTLNVISHSIEKY